MNFDLTEEQDMFCSSVERFAAPIDVEARRKLRLSPTGYDRERWSALAELGLIALAAPEETEAAVEGFDEQLRLIAAEQPEQTAEMLKVWLEEPAEQVEEKAA